MPSEVEDILLPYDEDNVKLLPIIEKSIRSKESINELLKITDEYILEHKFGFTKQEIKSLNRIWSKLLNRRLSRGGKRTV